MTCNSSPRPYTIGRGNISIGQNLTRKHSPDFTRFGCGAIGGRAARDIAELRAGLK